MENAYARGPELLCYVPVSDAKCITNNLVIDKLFKSFIKSNVKNMLDPASQMFSQFCIVVR